MNGEDVVVAPLAKGANYYWRFPSEKRSPFFREDPVSHIGKSFTAENGKGFTWAQNPDSVHRRCEKNLNRKIIATTFCSLLRLTFTWLMLGRPRLRFVRSVRPSPVAPVVSRRPSWFLMP